jgi:hypothetical protein
MIFSAKLALAAAAALGLSGGVYTLSSPSSPSNSSLVYNETPEQTQARSSANAAELARQIEVIEDPTERSAFIRMLDDPEYMERTRATRLNLPNGYDALASIESQRRSNGGVACDDNHRAVYIQPDGSISYDLPPGKPCVVRFN